jgi:uncharacterized NAD(P)/FAD-binding protein YdhS
VQSRKQNVICIVGAGVRGLGVLERIVAYTRNSLTTRPVCVHLIDPGTHGPEQYDTRQPDYLALNIVCGQVSLFPDKASVKVRPEQGPSLYEWAQEHGFCLAEDGFTVGTYGRRIQADDFLPRRLVGEYLCWFQKQMERRAPSHVTIKQHRAKAIDLTKRGAKLMVHLDNRTRITTDYVFLTVGQVPKPILPGALYRRRIYRPYPLPQVLMPIKESQTVAIEGLGLSAVDAILTLTIGRGGCVRRDGQAVSYIRSGNEPRIVAFSRSGLPYRSRPALGAPIGYPPVVFTRKSIDQARQKHGPKLDYDRDVLPLLLTELRIAYLRAKRGREQNWTMAELLIEELRQANTSSHLESYLRAASRKDAFDSEHAYFGALPSTDCCSGPLRDAASYENWYRNWVADDLAQARLGVGQSPLKAALEIFREFREVIRYAVDFGGLTDDSADRFFEVHANTLDRIGVGPQKESTEVLLALMDSGILRVPIGPHPNVSWEKASKQWRVASSQLLQECTLVADWLYSGRTSRLQSLPDDPSLIGSMARRGFVRRAKPHSSVIHALDVTPAFHPYSIDGFIDRRIWIFGLLCEGVTFYNSYITSPGKFVRSQYDADIAVAEIFDT